MLSRRGFRLLYSGLPLSGAAVSGALLSGGADGSASSSEPPMFRVTDTHYAKTWLLDPRSAKVEKPEGIRDIHNKLMEAFNI